MTYIRTASIEDIDTLNMISVQSKKYWGYPDDWIEKWMDELTLSPDDFKNHKVFNLTHEEKIIGFCAISESSDKYEVGHLWVLPGYIGKGYGKQLLNFAIRETAKTPKEIWVVADPNAESFYKAQGFTTFDKIESYPKGRFLPVMKKKVESQMETSSE